MTSPTLHRVDVVGAEMTAVGALFPAVMTTDVVAVAPRLSDTRRRTV